MEWTGAGLLPITKREDGEDYFLLSKDSISGRWGDLGGMRLGSETPMVTAARKAAEESDFALGTQESLYDSMGRLIQENTPVGPYRFYICRFKPKQVEDVANRSWTLKKRLDWVPVKELFQKIALHGLDGSKRIRIRGKTLRTRVERCLRNTTCYQAYLARHPDLKAQAAVASGDVARVYKVCYRLLPNTSDPQLVPLVVFQGKKGKPGSCFAVVSKQGTPSNWVIKDYTHAFNPRHVSGVFTRILNLLRKLFSLGPANPSREERWAVAHALAKRSLLCCLEGQLTSVGIYTGFLDPNRWQKL